jgi:hypothetical protein
MWIPVCMAESREPTGEPFREKDLRRFAAEKRMPVSVGFAAGKKMGADGRNGYRYRLRVSKKSVMIFQRSGFGNRWPIHAAVKSASPVPADTGSK